MNPKRNAPFDMLAFLPQVTPGKMVREYEPGQVIYRQGDEAEEVYFLREGQVKLTVLSESGKEAVIALLQPGSFFGEGCLAGQTRRTSNAIALGHLRVSRIGKTAMIRLLHSYPAFEDSFLAHLISRKIRVEEDLADQIFNSSEKRLARVLLLLARFGKESGSEPLTAKVSQETLAAMVGTTRSRVNFFMNKFKRLGFIEYAHGLRVHSSLLNVVLRD